MRLMGGGAIRPSNRQEAERSQQSSPETSQTDLSSSNLSLRREGSCMTGSEQGLWETVGRREGNNSLLLL